jgi:hypothetical protein
MAAAMARRGEAVPTIADRFVEWAAMTEIEDRHAAKVAETRREQLLGEALAVAETRRMEALRQLAKEQKRSDRNLRNLSAANQVAGSALRRRRAAGYWD